MLCSDSLKDADANADLVRPLHQHLVLMLTSSATSSGILTAYMHAENMLQSISGTGSTQAAGFK